MTSRTAEQTALSLASGAGRIPENRGAGQSVTATDPSRLTPEELAQIRQRVRRGERITF